MWFFLRFLDAIPRSLARARGDFHFDSFPVAKDGDGRFLTDLQGFDRIGVVVDVIANMAQLAKAALTDVVSVLEQSHETRILGGHQ